MIVLVCALLGSLAALAACSKHRPASLPIASIYGRSTARLEVTAIVITDEQRAERAREIYTKIAQLGEGLAHERKRAADRVTELTSEPQLDVEQIEAAIGQIKRDQKAAFVAYIALQMELRKTLTAREFEQLGRFD